MNREAEIAVVRAAVKACREEAHNCIEQAKSRKRDRILLPVLMALIFGLLIANNIRGHAYKWAVFNGVSGCFWTVFHFWLAGKRLKAARLWKKKFAKLVIDGEECLKTLENPYEN